MVRFAIISGLPDEQVNKWIDICEDAISEIKTHLKPGIDEKENENRLCAAAASLSFYRYILFLAAREGVDSFSIGEFSVRSNKRTSVEAAHRIWLEAKAAVSEILTNDDFSFKGV
jgi:kynurenine formamidase